LTAAEPGAHRVEVRLLPIDHPDAAALVNAQWAELSDRYGGGDPSQLDPADFSPPRGAFVVVYVDGRPVACGGFQPMKGEPGVNEIKRMYTAPDARRNGFSRTILAALESEAAGLGYREMALVTGPRQPEAIALYESSGYARRPNFGIWADIPQAICMTKPLP
jgi:GNAT superfamily N-acetyltransferase